MFAFALNPSVLLTTSPQIVDAKTHKNLKEWVELYEDREKDEEAFSAPIRSTEKEVPNSGHWIMLSAVALLKVS